MNGLRVLVVGSGGREHALCWRLATDPEVARVLAAPGNALMDDIADVYPDVAAGDPQAIVALARRERIDLVVVGPEAPLVGGLADRLAADGIACFGPTAAAARLEASKAFTRDVCRIAAVRMAAGRSFTAVAPAREYARSLGLPVVVKADGLAGGKGVTICSTEREVDGALREAIDDGRFGSAGATVVVEEHLVGVEASVIALCDVDTAVVLPPARDHKRLLDDDSGPNTGGMGAYSPIAELDDVAIDQVVEGIFEPVLAELRSRGTPFRGALFAGLMLTGDGPRVLEFNVRLGDPEAQAILPRLATPLAPLLLGVARGRLTAVLDDLGGNGRALRASPDATVALTLAAAGYPAAPRAGDTIEGIAAARAHGALVFGSGVRRERHGGLVTAGGRVLTVVGRGDSLAHAAMSAYSAAQVIEFPGRVMRRDIGRRAERSLAGVAS